jgi:hypothetical protein
MPTVISLDLSSLPTKYLEVDREPDESPGETTSQH